MRRNFRKVSPFGLDTANHRRSRLPKIAIVWGWILVLLLFFKPGFPQTLNNLKPGSDPDGFGPLAIPRLRGVTTIAAVASETGADIWVCDRSVHRGVPVRQTEHNERFPALSPDGRWLAYASDESGREEVFVEAFPGGAGRVQLSGDGGSEPIWSASGQEIFYRSNNRLMSVRVQPGATMAASSPTVLFEGVFDPGNSFGPPGYAVSPDARSFYFLRTTQRAARPRRIQVVLNWIEEFKQRVAK